MTITEIDEKFMREGAGGGASRRGGGRVPIGAVVVRDGEIVARAHNRRELDPGSFGSCRVCGLVRCRSVARSLAPFRLHGLRDARALLHVAGLMVNACVGRCVYGAADAQGRRTGFAV